MADQTVLDQIIEKILEVIIPDKIILFGSQARGDARQDSDYDILVIQNKNPDELETEQNIYRKLCSVNANVEVIVKTPENIEKSKNKLGCFIKFALAEGRIIYGET